MYAVLLTDAIATLCFQLGLPQWLVMLRHDASHSMLPSLPMLRTAALSALNWLKVHTVILAC